MTPGGKLYLEQQIIYMVPKPVIITPAPSNGTLLELQSNTNHVGHQRTISAPNANQLIRDGGRPFITEQIHRKRNNKPGLDEQNQQST